MTAITSPLVLLCLAVLAPNGPGQTLRQQFGMTNLLHALPPLPATNRTLFIGGVCE